jgi:hypothetical protein
MPTPIDKGKFRSESQLARSIYADLAKQQAAREKPPATTHVPSEADYWKQSPGSARPRWESDSYRKWQHEANQRAQRRK